MTIIIAPPDKHDDTKIQQEKKKQNPEPVHFFRNMLKAEAEIALPLSCRDSKNIRKRNNISGGKVMW